MTSMPPRQRLLPSWSSEHRPLFLEFRSSKLLIFCSIIAATFTDLFLYGVIVPVVPFALEQRVGISPEDDQHWVSILVAIYGVFLFVGCPLFGYISDITQSRRWPYVIGLLGLAGATGLLCAGTNLALWITGRAFQGLAGAVVCVTGTALLVDTVSKAEIGHYLGYLGAAQSLGILFGPLLGGVVYDKGGYYAVFAMCFAVIAVDVVLRVICIEKSIARKWLPEGGLSAQPRAATPDEIGENKTKGLDSKQDPPSEHAEQQQTSTNFDNRHEHTQSASQDVESGNPAARKKRKVPPVFSLLKSRRLLVALYGSFVQAVVFTAFDSTLPLFVQHLFQWDSLGAGLIFLPVALPAFVSPVVGYFIDKIGPRWFAAGGFLAAVPPLVCLRFVDHNSIQQKVLLCALLSLAGLCIASALPSLNAEISFIIDKKEAQEPGLFGDKGAYAQGYGLFWMAFAAGCLVGPLWGGFIQQAASWGTMTWTLALLSGTTAIPTALWTGGWLFDHDDFKTDRKAAGERALDTRGFA